MAFTLQESAAFDHEMFMSWVRAGFTEDQAMLLLLHLKAESMKVRPCPHCGKAPADD